MIPLPFLYFFFNHNSVQPLPVSEDRAFRLGRVLGPPIFLRLRVLRSERRQGRLGAGGISNLSSGHGRLRLPPRVRVPPCRGRVLPWRCRHPLPTRCAARDAHASSYFCCSNSTCCYSPTIPHIHRRCYGTYRWAASSKPSCLRHTALSLYPLPF